MPATQRALAVIPARGGSKRIPRKNLRPFLGQPIIKYSIDAALEAGIFDEIMVSSDDPEILEAAGRLGARVPFRRSAETSTDLATTAAVVLEVVEEYRRQGQEFELVCCLYPTAPFVTGARLREALALLRDSGADAVMPVTEYGFPIWRSLKIQDGRVAFNWPEHELRRSQDLPPAFHDCGQFYLLRVPAFLEHRRLLMPSTVPLVLPRTEVQDIDTEDDWRIAEAKYQVMMRERRP